jgi:hypothetical protein
MGMSCDEAGGDAVAQPQMAQESGETPRLSDVFEVSSPSAAVVDVGVGRDGGGDRRVGGGASVDAGAQQARAETLQSLVPSLAPHVRPATENEQVMKLVRAVYFHPDRRATVRFIGGRQQPATYIRAQQASICGCSPRLGQDGAAPDMPKR